MSLSQLDRDLLQAAKNMAYTQVFDCLEKGADVNARDPATGMTPLHYAVSSDVTDFVRDRVLGPILAREPEVNAQNNDGATPLHLAVVPAMRNAKTNTLQKLIDLGANSLLRDKSGKTPLDYARDKEGFAMFYATIIGFLENWEKNKPETRRYDEDAAANGDQHRKASTDAQDKLRGNAKKFKLKP